MRYFEDFEPGQRFDCGARTVSEAELVAFARKFDPQPYHLDRAAAETSPLKGLAMSGWHTVSLMMRMYFEGVIKESAGLGAPGVDAIRWLAPARPDAPISVTLAIGEKRESRSRPELGFVQVEAIAEQSGRDVCRYGFPVMVKRRDAEDGPLRVADRTRADAAELFEGAVSPAALAVTRLEDAPLDVVVDLGSAAFTAEEIVAFAREFDPQPFHLDEEAGKASAFGGLAASGWHVTGLWMRHMVGGVAAAIEAAPEEKRAAAARLYGPSPGVEALKWRLPALAGDRWRFFIRPKAVEDMPRRRDWGYLVSDCGAVNQFGALAFSMTSRLMVRRDASVA